MNEIYVIGHHNPDTDSIVSAMAYAALRNALGDRNYVAAHMDHISDQTQRMLDRFGFQPPRTVQNVRTQVEDLIRTLSQSRDENLLADIDASHLDGHGSGYLHHAVARTDHGDATTVNRITDCRTAINVAAVPVKDGAAHLFGERRIGKDIAPA